MNKAPPIASELVLIGGGHAHVYVLKMLGMPKFRQLFWESGIRVTLIAKDVHTPYSGMLPGFVAGHYTYDDIHLDLNKICRFSGIRLVHAACNAIYYDEETGGGKLMLDDGRPSIRFDCLSLDVGSTPSHTDQSIVDHPRVIPVKPIATFCKYYETLKQRISSCNTKHTLCVVGGGAGGIELALSVQYNLQSYLKHNKDQLQVVLVTRGSSILEGHNGGVRKMFQRVLKERNITIHFDCEVVGIKDVEDGKSHLILANDNPNTIFFDDCLWCTSAAGASWLQNAPFDTDSRGFIYVDPTYQVLSHRGVFAAGDCINNTRHPRPKAGVFAVRAGPPLLENIVAYLTKKPLKPHKPQSSFLGIISAGNPYAIASRGRFLSLEGNWVWKWKDKIDRKWMQEYKELPDADDMIRQMKFDKRKKGDTSAPGNVTKKGASVVEAFTSDPRRCGGSGAKVGSSSLSRVLKALHQRQVIRARERGLPTPPPIDHDDAAITPIPPVGSGPPPPSIDHDDAAITPIPPVRSGAMVNTIDFFRSIVDDPYVFGKIIAVHAISNIHAMGATAQTVLSVAVVPFAADEIILESTLMHLLSGISDVLQEENIQLVGGHTSEGTELSCGLAVQGYTENPQRLLRKRGGIVGDKIIITKSIGTGALFAADMRAKCKGEHMLEALNMMQQSNGPASRIAMDESNGVHACTDITGFGLVGNLLEMLLANDDVEELPNICAKLNLDDTPFLKGGLEASRQGILSTLHSQNVRNRHAISNHEAALKAYPAHYPLIFDPQTAGGLLMFVSEETFAQFCDGLKKENIEYAIIGEVVVSEGVSASADDIEFTEFGEIAGSEDGEDGEDVIINLGESYCTVSKGKTSGKRIHIEGSGLK